MTCSALYQRHKFSFNQTIDTVMKVHAKWHDACKSWEFPWSVKYSPVKHATWHQLSHKTDFAENAWSAPV